VSALQGHEFAWLLFMDPPRHTKLRAIVSRAFTSRALARLEARIRELSSTLLDAVADRGEVDLVAEYATPLPSIVIAEMLGLALGDWNALARWSETIVGLGRTISGTGATDAFRDADVFDPGRSPSSHIAFGHGIHYCLGAPLSRLEGRIALADLLARFASLELVAPEWPPRSSFHVLGPSSLRLRASHH